MLKQVSNNLSKPISSLTKFKQKLQSQFLIKIQTTYEIGFEALKKSKLLILARL